MYIKFVLPNDTPSLDGITTCPLQCRYEQKDFTNNLDCVTQNVLEAHFLIGPPTASGGVAVDPLVDVCLILMDWKIVDSGKKFWSSIASPPESSSDLGSFRIWWQLCKPGRIKTRRA